MYIIIVPIQIKKDHEDAFIKAMLENAKDSLKYERGCLRFDVIQDRRDRNRIWLYEVYENETAFELHQKTPHFTKWKATVKDWMDVGQTDGGSNIWPADGAWNRSFDNHKAIYTELCNSYRSIDDFRTKLLSLLPLATAGTGLFLLGTKELPKVITIFNANRTIRNCHHARLAQL